jgi:hypothetical protein
MRWEASTSSWNGPKEGCLISDHVDSYARETVSYRCLLHHLAGAVPAVTLDAVHSLREIRRLGFVAFDRHDRMAF